MKIPLGLLSVIYKLEMGSLRVDFRNIYIMSFSSAACGGFRVSGFVRASDVGLRAQGL